MSIYSQGFDRCHVCVCVCVCVCKYMCKQMQQELDMRILHERRTDADT